MCFCLIAFTWKKCLPYCIHMLCLQSDCIHPQCAFTLLHHLAWLQLLAMLLCLIAFTYTVFIPIAITCSPFSSDCAQLYYHFTICIQFLCSWNWLHPLAVCYFLFPSACNDVLPFCFNHQCINFIASTCHTLLPHYTYMQQTFILLHLLAAHIGLIAHALHNLLPYCIYLLYICNVFLPFCTHPVCFGQGPFSDCDWAWSLSKRGNIICVIPSFFGWDLYQI